MSNFRKTLPLPPPGRSVGEALEEGVRQQSGRKTPSTGRKSVAPRAPRLSSSSSDLKHSPKSLRGKSIAPPPLPAELADVALDRRMPAWVGNARSLVSALEEAIRSGTATPKTQAAILRAYAAWHLDGTSPKQLSRVAHLARRAYDAIRTTSRAQLEPAYLDCARVVYAGLPSGMRRRMPIEVVVESVRRMRHEADRWAAVVETTMLLVGWTDAHRARAAEAIREALAEFPPESLRPGE